MRDGWRFASGNFSALPLQTRALGAVEPIDAGSRGQRQAQSHTFEQFARGDLRCKNPAPSPLQANEVVFRRPSARAPMRQAKALALSALI